MRTLRWIKPAAGRWAIAVALLAGACSGGGPGGAPAAAKALPTLPKTSLVADCLTDAVGATPLRVDLCTVDLSGHTSVVVRDVDAEENAALSPDRTRIAFIDGGHVQIIDVDGRHRVGLDATGSQPEWLGTGTVGVITRQGHEIDAIELRTSGSTPIVTPAELQDEMASARISGFAVDRAACDLVASMDTSPADARPDPAERFALMSIDRASNSRGLLIKPTTEPIQDPDFGPTGMVALSISNVINIVDPSTGARIAISPPQWLGVSPTWSPDGRLVAWLANRVPGPDGPAVLVDQRVTFRPKGSAPLSEFAPMHIIGNHGQPLSGFPARPDW